MLTPRKRPDRVIVKLGTGVLTSGVGRLDTTRIGDELVNYDEWVARGS